MLVLALLVILCIHNTIAFECGVANDKPAAKIVGGAPVGYYKYPWFAALHTIGDVSDEICAGALITARHVLSAAHCFEGPKSKPKERFYDVTVGLSNRCKENPSARTFKTEKVVVHEKYDNDPAHGYDISLITLNKIADFMPVCLPAKGAPIVHVPQATIAGFGITKFSTNDQPCEMNEATVEIFTTDECKQTKINKKEMKILWETGSGFCAGYLAGGVDTCQGDSGGPLTVKRQGRHVQEGIVSFGYGCGDPNLPGVYSHVASYIDWIDIQTQGLSESNKPISNTQPPPIVDFIAGFINSIFGK